MDGVEYEVDCLIFATGFEVGTAYTRRAEFEVYGRNGVSLSDYWAKGMKTYYGFLSHGFPNLFHMGLTQTGLAPNFTYMLGRAGQPHRPCHRAGESSQSEVRGAHPRGRGGVGEDGDRADLHDRRTRTSARRGTTTAKGRQGQGFLEGQYPDGAVRLLRNARPLARTGGFRRSHRSVGGAARSDAGAFPSDRKRRRTGKRL